MSYKLVSRMVESSADVDPNITWDSRFVGVMPVHLHPEPKSRAMRKAIVPQYAFMCDAVDEAINVRVLQAWLESIEEIEAHLADEIEESTEGWRLFITRDGVRFEGQYEQGYGGHVSLAQFKLAVQTCIQFRKDPERKPVEVPFPEA
jgi:hypothetical protein